MCRTWHRRAWSSHAMRSVATRRSLIRLPSMVSSAVPKGSWPRTQTPSDAAPFAWASLGQSENLAKLYRKAALTGYSP